MQFVVNNWYLFLGLIVVLALLVAGPLTRYLYGIRMLPVNEAVRLINSESAVLIDVREPNEFRSGHIPNAVNVPMSGLAARLPEIAKYKDKPIVVSCQTSQRSARAALILRKHGFGTAHVLAGGFLRWQSENLPVKK
ncbi:MAG TPA: rhodanese-like domain-containing protein [Acidiferrobacterales bacterium]|jgi:rhodanese-related sulfurtransferase